MQVFNYDVLGALVSIADVDLLVALWRFSSYQGQFGEEFREFMIASLPALCEHYQLTPVQSFQEFVEAYDEKVYDSLCTGTPNDCLWFFASEGDLRNMKIALKKGANDFDAVVTVAAKNGHLHVVKHIGHRASGGEINRVVEKAASEGHLEILKFLVEEGGASCTLNWALSEAASRDHAHIVEYLVKEGNVAPLLWIRDKYNL